MRRIIRLPSAIARKELARRRRKARAALRLFARHYEILRQSARNHGYALAVHGSLLRDVDLIAVPWTDQAKAPRALKEALGSLCTALNGGKGVQVQRRRTRKPHGRVAYVLHFGETYIDLSIMPRRR